MNSSMKQLLLASSLVLSAISTPWSSFAQDSLSSPAEHLVPLAPSVHARVGMTRDELVGLLGQPSQKLSATVWVYSDFRAKNRPKAEQHESLVVVFNGDRVSKLRLTQHSLIVAALARVRADAASPGTTVAE